MNTSVSNNEAHRMSFFSLFFRSNQIVTESKLTRKKKFSRKKTPPSTQLACKLQLALQSF
jgi:hypothetical protein